MKRLRFLCPADGALLPAELPENALASCRILPDNGHLFAPVGGLLSTVFIPPELTPSPTLCRFSLLLPSGDRALLEVVSPLAHPLPPNSVFAFAAPGASLRAGQILAWIDLGLLRAQGGAPVVDAMLFSARPAEVLRTRKTRGAGGQSTLFLITSTPEIKTTARKQPPGSLPQR